MLVATRDFLGFSLESSSSFSPFTARHCQSSRLQLAKWTSSTTFKESLHWILEQPESVGASYLYQDKASINKMNYHLRTLYWRYWYRDCSEQSGDQLQPRDYLGLCIWDGERLGYLGLRLMPEDYVDPCWGPVRKPTNKSFSSIRVERRWKDLFRQEVYKFPGGQSHVRKTWRDLGTSGTKLPLFV